MKLIIKFLFLAAFCIASLKSSNLSAQEAPQKNYRYGVVENKSGFPVRVRLINKDGGERFYELGAGKSSVVPLNTKAVEVYYHESNPVGVTEKLDVEVYQSNTLSGVKKVPGFGDTVTFDEPTGAFPPSYLTSDYPAAVLPGASYPDEEEELNLMRLKHKNSSIRAEGASELGRLKSVKAVEPLIESMGKDKEISVKKAATQALGKIGNKESVKALRQVLDDKEWFARRNAAEALTNIEGDEAISALKEATRNDDGFVREVAIEELIKRKNPDIVDSFKDALKDKSEYVRADAIEALGAIGGEGAFDDLTAALKDKDFVVRKRAVEALRKTGNEQAKDALKEALAVEHDSFVRDDIQWVLDRIEARAKEKKLEAEAGLRDEELIKLNEDYMANEKEIERLEKENPTGEEIKLRKHKKDSLKEQFDERAKRVEGKYGPAWRDNYRKDGKLPGGLLEDNKSMLVKLNDAKKGKEEKVKKLQDQFEELKKAAKPVESREDRLLEDQRKLREDFVKEHGESSGWTDEVRKEYENALNELTQKSRKKWEEDKKSESENNRKLGKTIKELAEAKAELNQTSEYIEQLNKKAAAAPVSTFPVTIGEGVGVVKPPSLESEEHKEEAFPAPSAPGKSPVPKSPENEQFTLKVITVTANNNLADMDSGLRAYIMINGQETLKQELDDPEDDFEPGATDTFERTFNIPLSDVKSVSLVVDGDDEWLCERISFQFFTKDKVSNTYTFSIETLFSGESKDMDELGAVKSKTFNINPSADGLLERK